MTAISTTRPMIRVGSDLKSRFWSPAPTSRPVPSSEMLGRADRYSIADRPLDILDLGVRRDDETTARSDRAVAIGALVASVLAVVAVAVGIG